MGVYSIPKNSNYFNHITNYFVCQIKKGKVWWKEKIFLLKTHNSIIAFKANM